MLFTILNIMNKILPLVIVSLLLQSCASIVSGSNQSIAFKTVDKQGKLVDSANCELKNDKGTWFVKTPGSVTVNRSVENLHIDCKKNNLKGLKSIKSTTKGMAFGNILFGGIIGAGVDVSTGAAFDYPVSNTIVMESVQP